MARPAIAFIKVGSFSHVNERVLEILEREFSECDIDVIDVREGATVGRSLSNLMAVMRDYGAELVLGNRPRHLRQMWARNRFHFQRVKEMVARRVARGGYLFSLQTQSLFDASTGRMPHFVYTDHTQLANLRYPDARDHGQFFRRWIELEREIYANATIVFTTSRFASRSLVEDYRCDRDKVACVYSGINVPITLSAAHYDYSTKNILFVGRDWARKGGPQLAAAFRRVLAIHADATLTVIGCRPRLELPNCEVLGVLAPQALGPYYARASVFALPAVVDPSAVALVEAAAACLPVVATDVGGTPDRVVDGVTGYLVRARDVDGLAAKLIDLLGDPARCEKFGRQGHALAMERFRWERVGERMCASIRGALDREGLGAASSANDAVAAGAPHASFSA